MEHRDSTKLMGVGSGSKRDRDEESKEKYKLIEEKDYNNNSYPLLRDHYDCIHVSLDNEFTFNPPEIAQFLDFFVNREVCVLHTHIYLMGFMLFQFVFVGSSFPNSYTNIDSTFAAITCLHLPN